MRLIKLTSPNGGPVYVNPEQVCRVYLPLPELHAPAARTVLVDQFNEFAVKDEIDEVIRLLEME